MRIVPVVLYPILFGIIAAFASSNRIFAAHRTAWMIVFYIFLFGFVWIPYIFLPFFNKRQAKS